MKVIETTIHDLKQDKKNANKHSELGNRLLEKSISENGLGRSILLDKDNNIIAGNGVSEKAGELGIEKVRIIETAGTEIIAVKRKDLSIDSKKGRALAIADNQTAKVGIVFDFDVLDDLSQEYNFDFKQDYCINDFSIDTNVMNESDYETTEPKNKGEIDVNEFEDEAILKLKFDFGTYQSVMERLKEVNKSPEVVLLEALNL